ncbi:MAG: hypothetical protein HUU47_03970 [Bacteroidetes bacterium]|nr:hypothetical protein [Bacteroidota bacterium]
MNPIWIKNIEINRNKWDACINECSWGNIYSLSFYLDYITHNRWDALIIGDYDYIMPVPIKSKFGIEFTYRPDFCQQLGVFTKFNIIEKEILQLFLKKLTERFITFIYPLNHENTVFNIKKIKFNKKTNFVLNLNTTYTEIYSKYSNELKRNLKKTEKSNIRLNENTSIDELINIYKDAWQNLHFINDKTYIAFKKVTEHLIDNKKAKIFSVIKNDKILSACVIFFFKDRIYYPFSAITPDGKKNNSTEFMINEIIKKYCPSPLQLDFEGSDITNVKLFYKKFSPINKSYFQITKNVYFLEKFIIFRIFLKNVLHFKK